MKKLLMLVMAALAGATAVCILPAAALADSATFGGTVEIGPSVLAVNLGTNGGQIEGSPALGTGFLALDIDYPGCEIDGSNAFNGDLDINPPETGALETLTYSGELHLAFTPMAAGGNDFTAGYADGLRDGSQHSAMGWGIGGFAGGFLLGLIGGGGVIIASAVSSPQIGLVQMNALSDKSAEYRQGYIAGYQQAAKKKNVGAASLGAGAGILLDVVLISAMYSY